MAVERAVFAVLRKEGKFELRLYAPMVIAVSKETDLRGYTGFSAGFNYISGGNTESKKIAMTAPVLNELNDNQLTTAFVMPKQYSLKDLPEPADPGLKLKEIPERKVAAILFSGNVSQKRIEEKKAELMQWLAKEQITAVGPVELARYNPPIIPGFFKHNELLVEVAPDTE